MKTLTKTRCNDDMSSGYHGSDGQVVLSENFPQTAPNHAKKHRNTTVGDSSSSSGSLFVIVVAGLDASNCLTRTPDELTALRPTLVFRGFRRFSMTCSPLTSLELAARSSLFERCKPALLLIKVFG